MTQQLTDPSFKNRCACGCGAPVRRRFHKGHHTRLSGQQYRVEERGYETPCWVWQLGLSGGGYGHVQHNGKGSLAHRAFYEEHVGPIPEGYVVHHRCSVRACVNPAHLEATTHTANLRAGEGSKLSQADVRKIIWRRLGGETVAVVAADYGIAPGYVTALSRGAEAVLEENLWQ